MRKTLLTLLFTTVFCTAFAQEADIPCTIQKSKVFEDKLKSSTIISVDEDNNGGVIVARTYLEGGMFNIIPDGCFFEHYDADMKLIKEYKYEMKKGSVLGMLVNNDKVHMISMEYDKEKKVYICNAISANIKDFKFTVKELFRIEKKDTHSGIHPYGIGMGQLDGGTPMIVNRDKTAFAISVDLDDKEGNKESRKICVYDANLNLKIEHVFKRDIKDRKFEYENIDISSDGNVAYLLGKAYTDESKKKKDGGKYQYEITRITANDSKTQAFDTDEHYAQSLETIFKEGRIACVGFYSDRKDSRFKGLCYFEMDPVTLEIKKSKYNPFTEQFMIDKYGKDKDKELKNISFKNIFLTANNDIVFNAEEFYITYTTTTMGMGMNASTRTYPIYHYDDIVSAKMADNGDLVWARNINKRQASGVYGDPFISYTSMVKGDNTYFFINTGEKVKRLSKDRIQFGQKSAKRSNLNVIRINKDGDIDFKELLDDKDNEVPFLVSEGAVTTTGSSVYFIGRLKKKKQLLKLTL
jgi:hypothetical protein